MRKLSNNRLRFQNDSDAKTKGSLDEFAGFSQTFCPALFLLFLSFCRMFFAKDDGCNTHIFTHQKHPRNKIINRVISW
jgi:hypothetical protein